MRSDGTHALYPTPRQIGASLSDIQTAMNTLRDGVSAEKLVITLPTRQPPRA